jgi:hypothetical protein
MKDFDGYTDFEENYESASLRGGYFPGLWLPPLVVILIGLMFGFILSGVLTESVTASSELNNINLLDQPVENISETNKSSNQDDLSNIFTPEVLYWRNNILEWSKNSGMDPNLVATVIQIESCGDPDALSPAGAIGLFQVMPFHFKPSDDPYTPDTNALRGITYLKQSLDAANGDARLALAGYNGGISVIYNYESNWAAETQRYAYWGSGIFEEADQGSEISLRLAEWISNGGASLCKQAAIRLGLYP